MDAAPILTLATAAVVLAGALVPLYLQIRKARADTQAAAASAKMAARKADKAAKAAAEVHVIVNQQRTDSQRYTAVLLAALRQAGVDIPADASLDPPA